MNPYQLDWKIGNYIYLLSGPPQSIQLLLLLDYCISISLHQQNSWEMSTLCQGDFQNAMKGMMEAQKKDPTDKYLGMTLSILS